MTWYAHHVFAGPAALSHLAEMFPGHVFHVRDLAAYRRVEREVYARVITPDGGRDEHREVERGPQFPGGGLVVVRELCAPETHAAQWFGGAAVSWAIDGAADPDVIGAIVEPAPPAALLARLRAIARASGDVVSLVCVATWGGDIEYAFAWVFDAWGDRVYVEGIVPGRRCATAYAPGGRSRAIANGDALGLALAHHGLMLDRGYFELHTRGFPWDGHRAG